MSRMMRITVGSRPADSGPACRASSARTAIVPSGSPRTIASISSTCRVPTKWAAARQAEGVVRAGRGQRGVPRGAFIQQICDGLQASFQIHPPADLVVDVVGSRRARCARQRHIDRAGAGGLPLPPRGGMTPGGQVSRRPVSFGHCPDQLIHHLADNVVGFVGPQPLERGPLEDQPPYFGHQRLDQRLKVARIPTGGGLV